MNQQLGNTSSHLASVSQVQRCHSITVVSRRETSVLVTVDVSF